MGNKFNKANLAPGAWSSPWRFIRLSQMPEQVRVLLQDKLIARGRWVDLYLPVSVRTPGVVACTCTKDTSDAADKACQSCHGTKYAPGYTKFLRETIFWCSAESTNFTLTNTALSTTKKANVVIIADGQTSGTIVTQDKSYDNVNNVAWELKLDAYQRAAGQTVTLDYSTNAGVTWTSIPLTDVPDPGIGFTASIAGSALTSVGSVRMRVTLTRASVTDPSPAFEIVRLRRVRTENENTDISRVRPDHAPGQILILRPWVQSQDSLEPGRGRLIEHLGDHTWTAPLDFFDITLSHDTPACRIDDTLGLHPFYRYSSGIQANTNYAITKVNFSDQLGIFTQQFLDDRRAQDGETYGKVY